MTRFPFVLAFVMVAATTSLSGAPTAQAADVVCAGTLGGGSAVTSITGDVTVPEKASCTLDFVTVAGNVHVGKGASLVVTAYTEPSTISGNVEAVNCGSVLASRMPGAAWLGSVRSRATSIFNPIVRRPPPTSAS